MPDTPATAPPAEAAGDTTVEVGPHEPHIQAALRTLLHGVMPPHDIEARLAGIRQRYATGALTSSETRQLHQALQQMEVMTHYLESATAANNAQLGTADQQRLRDTLLSAFGRLLEERSDDGRRRLIQSAEPGLRALLADIGQDLERFDRSQQEGGGRNDLMQRQERALVGLRAWQRFLINVDDHPHRANLSIAALKQGLGTLLGTYARQWVGLAMRKLLEAADHRDAEGRPVGHAALVMAMQAMGLALLALPLALNIAASTRAVRSGTATWRSEVPRAMLAGLDVATLALCLRSGISMPTLMAFAAQVAVYSTARVLSASLMPTTGNAAPGHTDVLAASPLYTVAQIVAGAADRGLPGTGGASAVDASSLSSIASAAMKPVTGGIKAFVNALIEMLDEVLPAGIARARHSHAARRQLAQLDDAARVDLRAAVLRMLLQWQQLQPEPLSRQQMEDAAYFAITRQLEASAGTLRLHLAQEPLTAGQEQAVRERCQAELDAMGLACTPDAAPGSAEEQVNRLRTRYEAQALADAEREQPPLPPGRDVARTVAERTLELESLRMAFFGGLYRSSLLLGDNLADFRNEALWLTVMVMGGYNLFYGALVGRQPAGGAGLPEPSAAAVTGVEARPLLAPAGQEGNGLQAEDGPDRHRDDAPATA